MPSRPLSPPPCYLAHSLTQLHPDEAYHDAATVACQVLGTFMGQLNTDTDLYHALNSMVQSGAVAHLDEQVTAPWLYCGCTVAVLWLYCGCAVAVAVCCVLCAVCCVL